MNVETMGYMCELVNTTRTTREAEDIDRVFRDLQQSYLEVGDTQLSEFFTLLRRKLRLMFSLQGFPHVNT